MTYIQTGILDWHISLQLINIYASRTILFLGVGNATLRVTVMNKNLCSLNLALYFIAYVRFAALCANNIPLQIALEFVNCAKRS